MAHECPPSRCHVSRGGDGCHGVSHEGCVAWGYHGVASHVMVYACHVMDVAIRLGNTHHIRIVSGCVETGYTLTVNKQAVPLPAAHEKPIVIALSYPTSDNHTATCELRVSCHHRISLSCDPVQLDWTNADFFFNMAATLTDKHIARAGQHHPPIKVSKPSSIVASYPCSRLPLHGLLGASWCHAVYAPSWSAYEGDAAGYLVSAPFATHFAYTQWSVASSQQ